MTLMPSSWQCAVDATSRKSKLPKWDISSPQGSGNMKEEAKARGECCKTLDMRGHPACELIATVSVCTPSNQGTFQHGWVEGAPKVPPPAGELLTVGGR